MSEIDTKLPFRHSRENRSLATVVLPRRFLPLAFKSVAISFRPVADGYYAADNSGWQVKHSGDAFCGKLAGMLLSDGDIARGRKKWTERDRVCSPFFSPWTPMTHDGQRIFLPLAMDG